VTAQEFFAILDAKNRPGYDTGVRTQRRALYLLVTAFSAAVLYGSTYQQFRFFSLDRPGGAADAIHYVEMARGVLPTDPEVQHYRWVTPAAAHLVEPLAYQIAGDKELSIRLAFYLVNFAFSLATCVALFRLLQAMSYSPLVALLGGCAFASSRVTVLVTATPLVDAAYFCAIAIVVCLTVEKRALALALMMPVLVLTKETIIPFLLLPFLTEMRKAPAIWAGLAAAVVAFVISGQIVEGQYSGEKASVTATILTHAGDFGLTARRLLTLSGVHDLQNGFFLLLPLSGIGAWLNARHHYHDVPLVVIATVPIAFGLALLSGNTGRMFFAAFPAVIAYALIALEPVARSRGELARACGEN